MSDSAPVKADEPRTYEKEELKHGLKNRHIQMIAIGGAIGTGLFYGSSIAIQFAGPAVILTYVFVGLIIYFIMRANGEVTVEEPVSGSYASYAGRYLHRFWGFFMGWNVIFIFTVGNAAEFNALGRYIQYWFAGVPIWVTSLVGICVVGIINLVAVAAFGETEFWLAIIKVSAIIAMIIFGLFIIFTGIGNGGQHVGTMNLFGLPGGFLPNGIKGLLMALTMAAFSFGGVEGLSNTAGETTDVKKTLPRATNSLFWRILVFYVGAMTVMVTLFPWDQIGTKTSPFVTVFSKIGIPAAAGIINFVVITAALSALNSGIYVTSRMLYNQSINHNAPTWFSKVNTRGVPYRAIIAILIANLFSVIANLLMPETAFGLFSATTVLGLISIWATILCVQLVYRKRRMKAGTADTMIFKMPLYPWANYIALAFLLLVVVMIGFIPFMRSALYIEPIWIVLVYVLYLVFVRNKIPAPVYGDGEPPALANLFKSSK